MTLEGKNVVCDIAAEETLLLGAPSTEYIDII